MVDERKVYERDGTNFVAFIYKGSDRPHTSWSVYSYLITDADLPKAFRWLTETLPTESDANLEADIITCWSLGLVRDPARPTPESDVAITWIVGADVLNRDYADLNLTEQRIADEMLARRHNVALL